MASVSLDRMLCRVANSSTYRCKCFVSAAETALLTCGEEGFLEGILRQGRGVETGRQQGFDLGE